MAIVLNGLHPSKNPTFSEGKVLRAVDSLFTGGAVATNDFIVLASSLNMADRIAGIQALNLPAYAGATVDIGFYQYVDGGLKSLGTALIAAKSLASALTGTDLLATSSNFGKNIGVILGSTGDEAPIGGIILAAKLTAGTIAAFNGAVRVLVDKATTN